MKTRRLAKRPSGQLPSLPEFARLYIVEARDDRMAPLIEDGARLAVSRDERPRAGDIIVIWYQPKEDVPPQCIVRRMALNMAHTVRCWPHVEHPESEAHAALVYEQLNPPQTRSVECCKVLAVHKALGDQAETGGG